GGADIWGTADGFNYLYQSLFGGTQGGAAVRITALDDTNTFAKAGLMLRADSGGGSAHVILDVRPGGQIEFMKRDADGGATAFIAGAQASFPVWLRMVRTSTTVTGAISSDGVNWTDVGTTATGIGAHAMMGLVVTSHQLGVLATTSFDHLGAFEPQ
ncbi:MAG TPA: hypothetical protein VN628_04645, partial [Vicinamibacterales bacterium]|nr:hypothetical protein [Vicinamibacterales bacterium]